MNIKDEELAQVFSDVCRILIAWNFGRLNKIQLIKQLVEFVEKLPYEGEV